MYIKSKSDVMQCPRCNGTGVSKHKVLEPKELLAILPKDFQFIVFLCNTCFGSGEVRVTYTHKSGIKKL